MNKENTFLKNLELDISDLFKLVLRIGLSRPEHIGFYIKTWWNQRKASRVRIRNAALGISVPVFMIVSITQTCNLKCSGCYAKALHNEPKGEMSPETLRAVLSEAQQLGISIILLAGGEPLMRPDLITITKDFPKLIFLLFTNGMMMKPELLVQFKKQKNVIPILSLEGQALETDRRRGEGVYKRVVKVIEELQRNRLFYGISITVTKKNFDMVVTLDYVKYFYEIGSKLFFYINYIPVQQDNDGLLLTGKQIAAIPKQMEIFRKEFLSIFFSFPGDEERYGGCLSSGRGFIHVNAHGDVEPCPFSPFSTHNVKDSSLEQALQSKFLKSIRENHNLLEESKGGCALWENQEWVQSQLR